ncbi:U-box domain-containing protein [Trifolium repens]|nr:U-box domain-containing protein [Trifolium repens]
MRQVIGKSVNGLHKQHRCPENLSELGSISKSNYEEKICSPFEAGCRLERARSIHAFSEVSLSILILLIVILCVVSTILLLKFYHSSSKDDHKASKHELKSYIIYTHGGLKDEATALSFYHHLLQQVVDRNSPPRPIQEYRWNLEHH